MSKIKWGCVQPLTGGMYLGAEKAIGHPADWIISYPGLTDYVYDKEGNVIDAANERNIVNYLVKKDRMPSYYTMNRKMTQDDEDYNPVLTEVTFDERELSSFTPEQLYADVDVVIGVPVCAGLSMASTASAERKDECNCQMIWMAKYILNTIKPKVYVFENAPTLMSERGDSVRDQLQYIALRAGYSVVYFKTDTKYHHNCQKRPRTFIYFFRNKDGQQFIPQLQYQHDTLSVAEFFGEMPATDENDPMKVTLNNYMNVDVLLGFVKHLYGDNWREAVSGDLADILTKNKELRPQFFEWLGTAYGEKEAAWYTRFFNHVDEKAAQGLGYWSTAAKYFSNDCMPACMYKNVPVVLHYKEDRLYNMREWLYAMGHPTDFDMVGAPWNFFRKIGQNVPANTAKWVVSEAARIAENWDNEPSVDIFTGNVAYYDNTKQKRIW